MVTSHQEAQFALPSASDLVSADSPLLPIVVGGVARMSDGWAGLDSPGHPGHVRRFSTAPAAVADTAVQHAHQALPLTRTLTRLERANILRQAADRVSKDRDALGLSLCWEVGKSLRDSVGEVDRCVYTLRAAADAALHLTGVEEPLDAVPAGAARVGFSVWEPIGVVTAICGFNFPLLLAAHKVGAAVGAGCPVVVKPSDRTPFTTLTLATAFVEAGWPPGAISVLNGGTELGEVLVNHPLVRLVSFTGSTRVGSEIAQSAARDLKRCVLKLGSNAATIVAADADVDRAAALCATGATGSTGQSCISVQRIFVDEAVADEFIDKLVERVEGLTRGLPDDPTTQVGTVVSESERDRVLGMIADAVENGGRVRTGGNIDEFGIQPTVVDEVGPEARISREEVFGPVAAVYRVANVNEAIEQANSVPYGLMAGVFTNSITTAVRVARALEVGGVHINDSSNYRADNMPYGGVKHSGYGKEGPAQAMREMSNQKVITLHVPG